MHNQKAIKKALELLYKKGLKNLFNNANRFNENHVILDDLLFDYSKNYITKELVDLFVEAANRLNFKEAVSAMFNGEAINFTENRAVLHAALRDPEINPVTVNGKNYYQEIWHTFSRYCSFAEKIRNGEIRSSSKESFTDIVNIGIGGSYLPVLSAYEALYGYKAPHINLHFVANVDSISLKQTLEKTNPKTTLFVVASKTFTTKETMLNACSAKRWLTKELGEEAVSKHFAAVSTNLPEVKAFGITEENTFGFWDFIGGRFSLWSAIGLPLVIAIGKDNFLDFLAGAKLVDNHFKEAPLQRNIPFIMAILTVIYRNFLGVSSEAVIPYCEYLSKFPLYLQQVAMESNGKAVNNKGEEVLFKTSPVIFGETGTNAQHSFFQLLHQGSDIVPVDFIGFINTKGAVKEHQDMLVANLIAQSEALMIGKNKEAVTLELEKQKVSSEKIAALLPHKIFKGERPSTTLFFKELTPKTLGMLCALYEHKVFSLGILWQINSFDQYGVELGKELADKILTEINNSSEHQHDSSTEALVKFYKTS